MALDRDDIIAALSELVHEMHDRGEKAGIRIVGGAALSLRYFDRVTTVDVDASIHPAHAVAEIAQQIARNRDWPTDWLNTNATMFIPSMRDEWVTIWEARGISISVGSPQMLLAMKLNAGRPGRDDSDIASLLAICGIASVEDAEAIFDRFYPGEALKERSERILLTIFAKGLPPVAEPPPGLQLS